MGWREGEGRREREGDQVRKRGRERRFQGALSTSSREWGS